MSDQGEVPIPDSVLIDQHRHGNITALEALLCRHKPMIYALAYRILQNEADAADVTQHVLLKASTHVNTFRGDSSFKTWLFRIALNLSLNALRDRRRWQHEDLAGLELPGSDDPFNTTARKEARDQLRDAIRALPAQQRKTVRLRVYRDHSFAEIAAILGCRVETAKANYYYAVETLRQILTTRRLTRNTASILARKRYLRTCATKTLAHRAA